MDGKYGNVINVDLKESKECEIMVEWYIGDRVVRIAEARGHSDNWRYGDAVCIVLDVNDEDNTIQIEIEEDNRFIAGWWDMENFEEAPVNKDDKKKEVKTMGKISYKAKARLISNKNDEKLNVEVSFPDDLKELLNKCVVQSDDRIDSKVVMTTGSRNSEEYTTIQFKRFKVMRWVYQNCIGTPSVVNIRDSNGMDFLFNEQIVKEGKTVYSVDTFKQMDAILEMIKLNLNKVIEAYYKSQKYDMTITVNVLDGKDN